MPEEEVSKGDSNQVKSLVGRLAEACNAVGGVEKKGTNESQRYKYVKAADVAKAFRRELFTRGIVVIPDEKEFSQTGVVTTKMGAEMREFTLKMDYHICDSLSPAKITVGAFGVAMDTGDKAIWKCKTGALKYFLRTLGIVPDEKDDPEADEEVDKLLAPAPRVSPELEAKMESQQRVGQFQVKGIEEACKRTGKTAIEQAEYLKKLSLVQWQELQKGDFNDALKWAGTKTAAPADDKEMKRIFATAAERGIPEQDVKHYAYEQHAVDSMTKLSKVQLGDVLEWVKTI